MLSPFLVLILLGAEPSTPVQPAVRTANASADKKLCRKFTDTGSFVRKTKICRTRAEWRRIEEGASDTGRGLQSQLSTERGN